VSEAELRAIALALPGVEAGLSYGTPAYKLKGKLIARLHQDGESLVVKAGFDERELWMQKDPASFFSTDHYRDHPFLLVRLARVREAELRELLEAAWRSTAPRRLVAAHDAEA
jgi:hypothetical protein